MSSMLKPKLLRRAPPDARRRAPKAPGVGSSTGLGTNGTFLASRPIALETEPDLGYHDEGAGAAYFGEHSIPEAGFRARRDNDPMEDPWLDAPNTVHRNDAGNWREQNGESASESGAPIRSNMTRRR